MANKKRVTAYDAGISGDEQVRIALETIAANSGIAQTADVYNAVEARLRKQGLSLSDQGKASLRFYVNRVAVKAGYIFPYEKDNPGWRITPQGRAFLAENAPGPETLVNTDTQIEEQVQSNVARGSAFEVYVLGLLKALYPYYVWYHQGNHKQLERGLDFIGDRIGETKDEAKSIGVQVKFHQAKYAPTQMEWLKFLSGCFARRVDSAVFITTGQLTAEQRREAREANVIVIEGQDEISRLAALYKIERFELFGEHTA
ncbi:MAG: restriction endonuclease [Thermoflexales bacterium]|nr:restriction endonuclease [Thermoflexales bacterium]